MLNYPSIDLAGRFYLRPHYFQTRCRINQLIESYVSLETLHDRLQDLPLQFENPQPRPWKPIDWQAINRSQIIGIDPAVFLSVIFGAIEVESPIRGYSQVSGCYLQKFHPQMACFVGGKFNEDGSILEPGMWEKEERQHAHALAKVYSQLTGEKVTVKPSGVRPYQPSGNPHEDLYRHGLHRVATEYGATCLYIWLMSHSTGALQQLLAEVVQDEINHMTKFWGYGIWAFPESSMTRLRRTLAQLIHLAKPIQQEHTPSKIVHTSHVKSMQELARTFGRVMRLMTWDAWPLHGKVELTFTFARTLRQLYHWSNSLTPEYLQQLFGTPPLPSKSSLIEN